jgi:hypothetical protein
MSQSLKNEIEKIIVKEIPLINFYFKKTGVIPRTDGNYYTSSDWLKTLIDGDSVIGEQKYYYNFDHLKISEKLYSYVEELFPNYALRVSGHFYYPKDGFMSWHTNSDKPEKHVYITYVDEPGKSFFRSYVNDEIITDYDKENLTIRVFDIVNTRPYYWHSVYSDCNRYSFGFRLFPK